MLASRPKGFPLGGSCREATDEGAFYWKLPLHCPLIRPVCALDTFPQGAGKVS